MKKKVLILSCMLCATPILSAQTIENTATPELRSEHYDDPKWLDNLDKTLQSKDYEWLNAATFTEKVEKYPLDITYRLYEGHPTYRVINNYIYDTKGNLLRVICFTRKMINSELMKNAKKLVYAQDYKSNKHGIAQASSNTHYALKNRLGLSNEAGKKVAKQIEKALISGLSSYTYKQKKEAEVQSSIAELSLLNETLRLDDEQAGLYLEQLKLDHQKDFKYLYEISRKSDTEFKLTFLNDTGKASYSFVIGFSNIKPYRSQQTSLTMVATPNISITLTKTNSEPVLDIAETNPSFPEGDTALMEWIASNIQYPATCKEQGIKGRVYVQFIVEKDGSLSNIKIIRSPNNTLSKEAERLIKAMPKWQPGTQDGQPVRVKYCLPINFRI